MKFLTLDSVLKGQGPFHPRFYTEGIGGRLTTSFPPGTSIWMAPLYFLGQATAFIFDRWLPQVQYNSNLFFAPFYVTLLNVFFSAAACAVFYHIGRQLDYARRDALLAVFFLGLGTMLWPYSKFCYSEPQAAFFLAAAFSLLLKSAPDFKPTPAALSGICLSLAVITKYETVLILPVFAACTFWWCRHAEPGRLRTGLVVYLSALAAGFAVIAFWNWIRFGTVLEIGRYRFLEKNLFFLKPLIFYGAFAAFGVYLFRRRRVQEHLKRNRLMAAAAVLFLITALILMEPRFFRQLALLFSSPGKSLFLFSPGLAASFFLFRRFQIRQGSAAFFTAAVFLFYLLLLPSNIYNTAWQWGPRYFVTLMPFLMLPVLELASAVTGRNVKKAAAAALFAVSVLAQVVAVSVSYPDTFNYTSQKIARDTGVKLTDYQIEKKTVFPKLLSDWNYAPLKMQALAAASVAGKKLESLNEPLPFKQNVKTPEMWTFDFWWVYLYYYRVPPAVLAAAVIFLLLAAGGCLWYFLRFRRD